MPLLRLLLLLAACARTASSLPSVPADVVLLVIATEDAPQLHEAQLATFAGAFDPASIVKVTEANTSCVLCTENGSSFPHSGLLSDGNHPFTDKPTGWYCAMSRPLQALRLVARVKPDARWILMVDDDTYVHVPGLLFFLSQKDANASLTFGSPWGGGGGYVLSGTALRDNLMQRTPRRRLKWVGGAWVNDDAGAESCDLGPTVLDACISAQLGGAMCNSPGDWAISKCMQYAGVPLQRVDALLQQMCETTPPKVEQVSCHDHLVTCHKMDADLMHRLHDACEALAGGSSSPALLNGTAN